ncbi:MAG: hypothetical protein QM666_11375 [Acinetobacter sp.]
MKKQLLIALTCIATLSVTACAKKAEEAKNESGASAVAASEVASAPVDNAETSPEQQAQIDALDKPVDNGSTQVPVADATASDVKAQ